MPKRHDSATNEWIKYGEADPYYGVLSEDRFRRDNMDDEALAEFFRTGQEHVAWVLELLAHRFHLAPKRVLDFGCGTGRLTLPFARVSDEVIGIDVSNHMLAELATNAESQGIANISTRTNLADDVGTFDLVHSFIVFQHIPVEAGMRDLRELLSKVRPGGVAAIQMTTAPATTQARLYFSATRRIPALGNAWNLAKRRPWSYPVMQMNAYEPSTVVREFTNANFDDVWVRAHTDHTSTGFHSLWYVAQRTDDSRAAA